MGRIETLHAQLDFDQYAPKLRAISGYWTKLIALQLKAKRDAKFLSDYRQLLERGIAQAKTDEGLSDNEFTQALSAYNAFYQANRTEFGVADMEGSRFPSTLEGWTERHLPKTWEAYMASLGKVIESGSAKAFDQLRAATVRMLENYVNREDK
jgi:hypothetical protein